jgi:hypothetical protein
MSNDGLQQLSKFGLTSSIICGTFFSDMPRKNQGALPSTTAMKFAEQSEAKSLLEESHLGSAPM